MGQIEVYELLRSRRLTGDDTWFSVSDVEKLMREAGYTNGCIKNVRASLLTLYEYKYLDSKMVTQWSDWKRLFRLAEKKYMEAKNHG